MDISEIMKMLKDPQAIQKQAMEAQARMATVRATGSAGGGFVKITLSGAMEVCSVEIAQELLDSPDKDMLQDLIKAAFNDAFSHLKETMQSDVANNLNIPGLGL